MSCGEPEAALSATEGSLAPGDAPRCCRSSALGAGDLEDLLANASVYILDVDGQRQVFMAYRPASSDEFLAELQAVLDSIHIEP
jgi:hypothetical protein